MGGRQVARCLHAAPLPERSDGHQAAGSDTKKFSVLARSVSCALHEVSSAPVAKHRGRRGLGKI